MQELLLVTSKAGFRQSEWEASGGRFLTVTIPTKTTFFRPCTMMDMPPRLVQTMTMEKNPANWELDARTVGILVNSVKSMEIQPILFWDDVIFGERTRDPWF